MNFIASTRQNEGDLRVHFSLMDEWTSYHAAVEDGFSGAHNVHLKAKDAADSFDHLRPGHSLHPTLLKKMARENYIKHDTKNIGPSLNHIWMMTEDMTASFPVDIWTETATRLSRYVDPNLLYLSNSLILKGEDNIKDRKGRPYIVVTDIGPILKSARPHKFFETLRRAALKLGHDHIPYINHSDCAITRLSDSREDGFIHFEAENEQRVFLPHGIDKPILESPRSVVLADDYLCTVDDPSQPLTAHYEHYLSRLGPRAMIMDKIITHMKKMRSRDNIIHFPQAAHIVTEKKPEKLKIVQLAPLSDGWNLTQVRGHEVKTIVPTSEDFIEELGMRFQFKPQTYRHPDVIILPPFDANDSAARIHAVTAFTKATTAKQIDPRFYRVPIVVVNLNGCYDQIMAVAPGLHQSWLLWRFRPTRFL